ncbi:cysteine dioxygenase [Fictibacillus iocasae]|uniref:Cysteine dioxygenase n=1 Tax=Fictibacillus iocasae TaxID=2715437 RepID=A0ABW2NRH7_9BACL
MAITTEATFVLDTLRNPTRAELLDALMKLNFSVDDVEAALGLAGEKPYFRKLLYKSEDVEMLVMNWSDVACAPHDHGDSHGYIHVLEGESVNTVYEVDEGGLPSELFVKVQKSGQVLYAPRKGVHKMQAAGGGRLVTLHLYAPPISGMKVYDLEACAVCVVSDDCGAWWPEETRQKVREIKLERKRSGS